MQGTLKWGRALVAAIGFAGVCYITACATDEPAATEGPAGEAQEGLCLSNVFCNGVCCTQPPHTNSPTCSFLTHSCLYGSCSSGYADCNGNLASDGCETNLSSPGNCGACGNDCNTKPHVATNGGACVAQTCVVTACAAGFSDCNGLGSDGCETTSDANHCGSACTTCTASAPHTVPVCTNGTCAVQCAANYGDCNGNMSDGCETFLNTDAHCGSCSTRCTSTSQEVVCQSNGSGGFACSNLPCGAGCPTGLTCVSGSCVDIFQDPCFCGQAQYDNVCAGENHTCCSNGTNAQVEIIGQCPSGFQDIGACCGTPGNPNCPALNQDQFGVCRFP
jgi:hypothetical protein